MKVLRLDLMAFGSLSGTHLELGSERPALQLVYGPNEAGKSTALRALHGLFFGIPETTLDAHRFKPSELRVGALLRDARGRELYVVRRKGRKHTLTAADGTPLTAADVAWAGAGVSEAQYRSMFSLSYDTLEEGADELLGSAGELGQSLFSAGTGGTGAHAVLDALRQEADAIYRPRGRTQRLNEALAAFEAAKRSVREQAIRSEAFGEQQRAIDEAEAEARSLQLQRQALAAERARLERARRVLPLFVKRTEYVRQREALGEVPRLPETAAEDRRGVERALRDASLRIEHVERELLGVDRELAGLDVDPAWLAPENQPALVELRDRLAQYRRAQRALPGRRLALERAQAAVTGMLAQLGLSGRVALAELDALRLTRPFEAELRDQARRGDAMQQRVAALARQLAAKRDDIARQRRSLEALRGLADAESKPPRARSGSSRPSAAPVHDGQIELPLLSELEPREVRPGPVFDETVNDSARAAASVEGAQSSQVRSAAHVASGTAVGPALDAREAPLSAASDGASDEPLEPPRAGRSDPVAQTRTDGLASRTAPSDAPPDALPGPSPRAARSSRPAAGSRGTPSDLGADVRPPAAAPPASRPVRVALRLDQIDELERACAELEREQRVLAERRYDEQLAFEQVLRELDVLTHAGEPPTEQQLAAARAARADRSAELRASLARGELAKAKTRLEALERQTEAADVLADRLRREATRVAEFARLRAAHAASERKLRRMTATALQLQERAELLDQRWRDACAAAGVAVRPPSQMRAFLSEERAETARLEQLEVEAQALERELAAEQSDFERWRARWNDLVRQIGCPDDASIAEVEALVAGLNDLFARADAVGSDAREIEQLERECAGFEADLKRLRDVLIPELGALAVEAAGEALLERHAAARRGAERRRELAALREARRVELAEAHEARQAAQCELEVLMRAAEVGDPAALESVEVAAARLRALDAAVAQVDAELLDAADGFDLAGLARELAETLGSHEAGLSGRPDEAEATSHGPSSMPVLQARLQEVEDALERVELAREHALQTLESRRGGLSVLRESRGAADAALDCGAHLETVRLLAQRYVRVKLAYGVLTREVERYRERHTAPILRAASRWFAQLTHGAWSGLEADFGDADRPLLLCVRDDGERVGVLGLSAGARDQLYLALRLASIEQLAASRELLPVVLDDVLVHFDDDRARAALRALGEFAQTTQVLLFTHHARLCELAEQALASDALNIHRLASRPPQRSLAGSRML